MKFRRQRPFGPFVVDFICADYRLVVEVDGPVHDDQTEQDAYRSEYIASYGFTVIRFRNDEVLTDLPSVVAKITTAAQRQRSAPPSPADGRGGLGG
jgi:very-short-patch-repair endonuclease